MLESDREQFDRQMGELFAALDKPLTPERKAAFFKGCAKMTILQSARAIDSILADMDHSNPPARFTVSDIWTALRRLRSAPPSQTQLAPPPPAWTGDAWDIQANEYFLRYLRGRIARGARYADVATVKGARPASDPSQETRDLMAPLLMAKEVWTRDMRDADQGNGKGVDAQFQRSTWREVFENAEREVQRISESYAAWGQSTEPARHAVSGVRA